MVVLTSFRASVSLARFYICSEGREALYSSLRSPLEAWIVTQVLSLESQTHISAVHEIQSAQSARIQAHILTQIMCTDRPSTIIGRISEKTEVRNQGCDSGRGGRQVELGYRRSKMVRINVERKSTGLAYESRLNPQLCLHSLRALTDD